MTVLNPGRKTAALALIAIMALAALRLAAADPVYSNKTYGFRVRQPAGWERTTRGPFIIQFHEKSFQAFIIVDAVVTDREAVVDAEFKQFIAEKNDEVKRSNSSFKVYRNASAKIGGYNGYVTQAGFQSGPDQVAMDIYYIPMKNTIFMITTACPQSQAAEWQETFFMTLGSFGELK